MHLCNSVKDFGTHGMPVLDAYEKPVPEHFIGFNQALSSSRYDCGSRSGKSDFYALPGKKTGEIVQVKLYKDRLQSIDFDWGHKHMEGKGKNKTIFPEGVVHAHEYAKGERTGTTRYMSNEEINFFGDLFKSLNPSVKFRP